MRVHILNDCKRPGKVTNTDKSPADKEEGAGRGDSHPCGNRSLAQLRSGSGEHF